MKIRNKLLCAAMLVSLSSMPAAARVNIDVGIGLAPPPARYEVVPELDYGYVWIPGYWDWDGGRYVWVRGHEIREYPGYVWRPYHWEQRGRKWYRADGDWERDEHYRGGWNHRNNDYDHGRNRRHH